MLTVLFLSFDLFDVVIMVIFQLFSSKHPLQLLQGNSQQFHLLHHHRKFIPEKFFPVDLQDLLRGIGSNKVPYSPLVVDDFHPLKVLIHPGNGIGVHSKGDAQFAHRKDPFVGKIFSRQYLLAD